ncbi:MAG: hypothetical protein JSU68_07805 [Phycisphaerales bacterium]|nr:MAG: hypothetical protein JSU68_07805 [Phycisphaerales bacterium]
MFEENRNGDHGRGFELLLRAPGNLGGDTGAFLTVRQRSRKATLALRPSWVRLLLVLHEALHCDAASGYEPEVCGWRTADQIAQSMMERGGGYKIERESVRVYASNIEAAVRKAVSRIWNGVSERASFPGVFENKRKIGKRLSPLYRFVVEQTAAASRV